MPKTQAQSASKRNKMKGVLPGRPQTFPELENTFMTF
jgi:hypothetical protein